MTCLTEQYDVATQNTRSLFAIIWMEHEYEPGWGVTDRVSHISIYNSLLNAHEAVAQQFAAGRSLYGAGDYFIYPSGPNDSYDVAEITLPADHPAVILLERNGRSEVGSSTDDKKHRMYRDVNAAIGDQQTVITNFTFEGLNPKPVITARAKNPSQPEPVLAPAPAAQ